MSLIKVVSEAMGRIAPLRLAEKWDNVGVLLESPVTRQGANNVLLTIDLTPAVLQEALQSNTSVVVSYHPPIFSGLKSLRLSNPLQNTLLQCAANGISVYTPHTSIDSVWGGINDFLATAFTSPNVRLIDPNSAIDDLGGLGRIAELPKPLPMSELQELIRKHLGLPQGGLQVAYGSTDGAEGMVKTVAICAGSGASVFKGVKADLYWTGEMLHHEVLAAVGAGRNVILCGHTNTERPYLPVLAKKLEAELKGMRSKQVDLEGLSVSVSQADKHPLAIV